MRRAAVGVALAAAFVAAGCGERDFAPPLDDVVLRVEDPGDDAVVDAATVQVRGTVQPAGARVMVDGEAVPVSGGAFSTAVALDAGANVIDVQAAAPRHPSAMTALRVTRQVRVAVPVLDGQAADAARDELAGLGLDPDVQDVSSVLDDLFGDDDALGVCYTEPDAGTEVLPGERVTVAVAPGCLDG